MSYEDKRVTVREREDRELMRNGEHYPDPTAYIAIKRADNDANPDVERHHKLIGAILRVCELAGYEVVDRIVVKDKYTGKVWR